MARGSGWIAGACRGGEITAGAPRLLQGFFFIAVSGTMQEEMNFGYGGSGLSRSSRGFDAHATFNGSIGDDTSRATRQAWVLIVHISYVMPLDLPPITHTGI